MEVVLHTAAPYKQSASPLHAAPYRHVIGVSAGGTELWRPDRAAYSTHKDEPVAEPYPHFSERLMAFFGEHITSRPDEGRPYNCHLAATVFTGEVTLDDRDGNELIDEALAAAYRIVNGGDPVDPNLPLGVHGVIGLRRPDFSVASHSVIGLGEERNEFLEVDRARGTFGIQQYERCLPDYAVRCKSAGLYVASPH